LFFFFQAEDGIRDFHVTGVQTCALPISAITDDAWRAIKYTDAIYDEEAGQWVSRAEVAEIDFTAFTSKKTGQVPGRLVVRRIPRSEERRVGKECSTRWSRGQSNSKANGR